MAEKVFQLLERLKLTELSKTKAMESLKKKENEVLSLSKTNNKLSSDLLEITKIKDKLDIEKKEMIEQIKTIRKHNLTIINKSKEDSSERLSLLDQLDTLKNEKKVSEARLSLLVSKIQQDEDARILYINDIKKLELQINKLSILNDDYIHRIQDNNDIQRNYTTTIKNKTDEYNALLLKYEDTIKELNQRDMDDNIMIAHDCSTLDTSALILTTGTGAKAGAPDDIENVRANEGMYTIV